MIDIPNEAETRARFVIATPDLIRGRQSRLRAADSGLPRRSASRNDDMFGERDW